MKTMRERERERERERDNSFGQKIWQKNKCKCTSVLTTLPKIDYNQVKLLASSHLIWKALENSFEVDAHSKNLRLKSWICAFQDA